MMAWPALIKPFFLKLVQECRGASLLETAAVMPILLAMAAGASTLSVVISEKIKIQQAAARAAEMATAGGLNSAAFQSLQTEAATAAGVPTNQVTVTAWLECSGVAQSDINGICATGQTVARYVSIAITDTYTPSLPFTGAWLQTGLGGSFNLTGFAEVRVQ